MKTNYKHIGFEFDGFDHTIEPPKGNFCCYSKNEYYTLGWVRWYADWKQYCFFTNPDVVLSKSCMMDIADFIEKMNDPNKKIVFKG